MSDAETLTTATEPTPVLRHRAGPQTRPARGDREDPLRGPAALTIIALFGYPVVKNLAMSFQNYTLRTFINGEARGWGCRTTWPW